MSHNLTEVDEHTANVAVPDDGDARNAASVETPFQALANRTLNAKNRLDNQGNFAAYSLSNTPTASGSKIGLTLEEEDGSLTLASDEVEVPAAGLYLVSLHGDLLSSQVANPSIPELAVYAGANLWGYMGWTRLSATDTQRGFASVTLLVPVTTPATEKIKIESLHSNTTIQNGWLTIVRLT